MPNECFEFYSSCCTNRDHGRLWIVWERHPCMCRTEAHHKMHQVVKQSLSAPFVWRGPFLEDSVQQMSRWGLPSVWYLFTSRCIQANPMKASFPERSHLLPTNEAFIKVQLWMKHRRLRDQFLLKTCVDMLRWFACLTLNVWVEWNVYMSCDNFYYVFSSLLDTIPISQPLASCQPAFFNGKICFDQIDSLFLTTAHQMLIILLPKLKLSLNSENIHMHFTVSAVYLNTLDLKWTYEVKGLTSTV